MATFVELEAVGTILINIRTCMLVISKKKSVFLNSIMQDKKPLTLKICTRGGNVK